MNSDDDQCSVSSDTSKTRSTKGSFRRRLKSLGSTVDKSRNSFIDGTKTVSSRFVKKTLRRRSCKEVRADIKEEVNEEPGTGQVCEIFESIKFDFPASPSNNSITFAEQNSSDDEVLPPPQFPPPPLPEQFFDDVFSDQSSNSYSDSHSQFDLLSKGKAESEAVDVPFYTRMDNFDLNSETLSNSFGNESELRSNFGDDFADNFNSIFASFDAIPPLEKENLDSFFSSSETGSSSKSMETRSYNHCYENWNLSTNTDSKSVIAPPLKSPSPTKSVILQFDPLYHSVSDDQDNVSLSDLFAKFDIERASEHKLKADEDPSSEASDEKLDELLKQKRNSVKSSSSVSGWSIRKALKVVADNHWSRASFSSSKSSGPSLKTNDNILGKPEICATFQATLHNGHLCKASSNIEKGKDFVTYWCQLTEGKFYFSLDKDNEKESIDLDTILSIHLISDRKTNNEGDDLYCFEITVSTKAQKYIFATLCTSERCVWMQKLFENLTLSFPARLSTDYIRAGWCFLKECINGTWTSCWILLQKRTLAYTRGHELVEIDLRKARHVGLQETDDTTLSDKNNKQMILLDTVTRCLYLIMGRGSETVDWQRDIRAAAIDSSRDLEDQQLTKDDIPVIVDKCINFVYAHGSMSEGIYRRSGSNSSVTKLLSAFRQDSWAVQLSRQEYTEYDVANVLKRFFRDLPEPLFTVQLHKHFCNAPAIECSEEDKLLLYRSILEQLKPINYVTVRKLIGHLYYIQMQRQNNYMTVENLASIWGPTLMHVENNDSSQWLNQECKALSDLISLFPKLFLIDESEIERENKIREVLEKHHNSYASIPQSFKPSGDLKVWIYLKSKEDGNYVNITVNPNKTCESVCQELADKINMPPHLLCLHEVICNESLTRPMHYKERLLDSVLRWGYWDEIDRKNNYLLLSTNNIIRDILPLAKAPLTVCNELMFADRKMKSFKTHNVELSEGTLALYKDKKQSTVKMKEWNIEDIMWYLGFESKRNPRCRWAITFIDKSEKQNRLKETPFFGYTIAGTNKEDRLRWIAALVTGKYPDGDLMMPVSLLK